MMPYISPTDKGFEQIPYMPFIDYRSGKTYDNSNNLDLQSYWKPLYEVFFGRKGYINHPESKSEGNIGQLERKTITISKDSIIHIGKETNELEESQTIGVNKNSYTKYENSGRFNDKILNMNEAEARELGISRDILYHAKFNIRKIGNVGRSYINKLLQSNQ